jgi:hypothetical protein
VSPLPPATFDFVVFESVIIGAFVGISLALAQLLRLEKAYWVPVSYVAVIQSASLLAVWNRQLQRVLGTAAGLAVAWALLLLPLGPWGTAATLMVLTVIIETLVVRHYAAAVVFITPLTILLAEAAILGTRTPAALIEARFIDTVLGCVVAWSAASVCTVRAFAPWWANRCEGSCPGAPTVRCNRRPIGLHRGCHTRTTLRDQGGGIVASIGQRGHGARGSLPTGAAGQPLRSSGRGRRSPEFEARAHRSVPFN